MATSFLTLQPCDWHEHDLTLRSKDSTGKWQSVKEYVVDVFGRTCKGTVACLRIKGFKPFFYVQSPTKPTGGVVTRVSKYDVFAGFTDLVKTTVWKVECDSKAEFSSISRSLQEKAKFNSSTILYETGLPPFLRLFHLREIGPASPIRFRERRYEIPCDAETEEPLLNVDAFYQCNVSDVTPAPEVQIPMKVASYDLEMYSASGLFPQALKDDPIVQIGVSYRWSNDLLTPIRKRVFVAGTVDECEDADCVYVACEDEEDMLRKFCAEIQTQNPDVMCGYNIFGFDDAYIEDRCRQLGILEEMDFTRSKVKTYSPASGWQVKFSEKKSFELASGKYDLRYMALRGRLGLDLLLNMRREHSLDSFKLDSVASVFLRDRVLKYEKNVITTKSTRGLAVGNYVRFDIVGNTTDPYREGAKYRVSAVSKGQFTIEADGEPLFADLDAKQQRSLEWTLSKDDVEPHDLFRLHAHGGPAGRARIAKYCIQDCDLVLTLMAKLDTIVNARGMADVCKVPMEFVLRRGQGIKIFSAVVYYASQRDQILRTQEAVEGDMSYEGAIVIPPKIGIYLDQPISVLDFNSLYPTNMIAYNISPDTLVAVRVFNEDGQLLKGQCEGASTAEMAALEEKGWIIEEVSYDNKDEKDVVVGSTKCYYVQPKPGDDMTVGVLPKTLDILLKKRKEFKNKMEDEVQYDEAQRSVFNGLQLAYKVVANSVYGQTGSRTSPIRKLCVAACTTAAGRKMLNFAKSIVETEYGATVIYGDSVASYTPVTVRKDGRVFIQSVEELCGQGVWRDTADGEKQYCELTGVESWTERGWTPLHRVIRHALAPTKKMVRVLTHCGLVDVTDDHSLLRQDGTEVSPRDLSIGDALLHHTYPPAQEEQGSVYTEEHARVAGFFCGDGSCGFYECPSGDKSSWALNNANIALLSEYQTLCQRLYPAFTWNILPTLSSSGVYKLVPNGRGVKEFVLTYRADCYVGARKNIPDWVMNGSVALRQAFWDGFYDADGDKDMHGYVRIDQKHQTTCAQLAWLGASLGYSVSLNTREDKPETCRMTFTTRSQRRLSDVIKKMHVIEYSGYVYDLTTESHHFQAGVGTMIVHNTDSIFIKFPTKELVESIKMGIDAGQRISDLARKPYKIAYEKTFYPFILFCRKRYVGMMYEEDPSPAKAKRKSMGVVLKRRDNAPIVKDIFGGSLDIIMQERDIHKAQTFVNDMLHKLLRGEMPLEKFIISKSLRDDYKLPEQIAHRVLADRMGARDPGNAPKVGDRIQYIYVAENKGKAKQGDRIEQIDYVRANGLHPDAVFYITNQIQNPVAQLFALCIEQLDGYEAPRRPAYETLMQDYLEKYNDDEEEATKKVLQAKEKHLERLMFLSSPSLSKIVRSQVRGPMDAFVRR